MRLTILLILGLLFSLYSHANVSDLVGKSYDKFISDFPEFYESGGACLLDCKYGVITVRVITKKENSILLVKPGAGTKKWDIIDVIENVTVKGDGSYVAVSNCTKHFSKMKNGTGTNSRNLVAIINPTGKEKTPEEQELWVNAIRAFSVDTENNKFEEISTEDVYCYAGMG